MRMTPTRKRFTVAEYYRMAESGIIRPDERTELIRGEVIHMPPIGPGHAESTRRVPNCFARHLGSLVEISVQNPVRLPDESEPQPDVALLHPRPAGYGSAHPRPADIYLVVEVSDSTLNYDRRTKLPLYAAAGIAEAWLMDLRADQIEVHRDPTPAGYRTVTYVQRGGALTLLSFPDVAIPCSELLPIR